MIKLVVSNLEAKLCGIMYFCLFSKIPWRPKEIKLWRPENVKLWQPNERVESFEEININNLYNNGIRVLVLDVDGNITTFHGKEISKNIEERIQYARSKGIEVWILSNCDEVRERYLIEYFSDSVEVVTGGANKPSSTKLLAVMHKRNKMRNQIGEEEIYTENMAVVGDQYSTDIQLGNSIGTYTIKVDNKKLARTEPAIKQIQRGIEEWLYKRTFPKYSRSPS